MPMDSAFRRRFAEYHQVLQGLTGETAHTEQFNQFLESISELNDRLTELEGPDAEGNRQVLGAAELQTLKESYTKARARAEAFIGLDSRKTLDKQRRFMTQEFRSLLTQDLAVLDRIQPEHRLTLEDAFHHARTLRLDLTGSTTASEKGGLSSRVPVAFRGKSGKAEKGFFTRDSGLVWPEEVLADFRRNKPEYNEIWKVLGKMKPRDVMVSFARKLPMSGKNGDPFKDNKHLEEWMADPNLFDVLEDFRAKFTTAAYYQDTLKATVGSGVTDRNCAMSRVAMLLGDSGLVARAQKAALVRDGEIQQGCLMEQASGSDLDKLTENDPILQWGIQAKKSGAPQFTGAGLRKIADLQVLDFVCGNIDRHRKNMFYQFDTSDGQNPRLSGVVGIDNDAAFGTYMLEARVDGIGQICAKRHATPIDNMIVISDSMAARIMSLTGDGLDYALRGYKLSHQERKAAAGRLEALQDMIVKSQQHYRGKPAGEFTPNIPRVISDQDFEALAAGDTSALFARENHFSRVKGGAERAREIAGEIRAEKRSGSYMAPRPVNYAGVVEGVVSREDQPALQDRFRPMKAWMDRLSKQAVYNTSEFHAMQDALKALVELPANGDLSEAVKNLQEKTRNYIKEKKVIPETDRGKERLHLARQLEDLCVDVRQEIAAASVNDQPVQPSFRQQMKERIQDLSRNTAAAANALLAVKGKEQTLDQVAILAHLGGLRLQLTKPGNGRLLEMVEPEAIEREAGKLKPVVKSLLTTMSKEELQDLLRDENAEVRLHQRYTQHAGAMKKQARVAQQAAAKQTAAQQLAAQQAGNRAAAAGNQAGPRAGTSAKVKVK